MILLYYKKKKRCAIFLFEKVSSRNSLAVQWVGFGTFTTVAWIQILASELRSHRLCSMAQKNHFGEKSQIKNGTAMKQNKEKKHEKHQFSSVAQSCPTLCDPMNRSAPGLPVYHQLPEFTQTQSIKSVMPSGHLILCRPLLLKEP